MSEVNVIFGLWWQRADWRSFKADDANRNVYIVLGDDVEGVASQDAETAIPLLIVEA